MHGRGILILVGIIVLSVLLQVVVIGSLDLINTRTAVYGDLSAGIIRSSAIPEGRPLVLSLPGGAAGPSCLSIVTEPSQQLALVYEDVHAPYRLSIGGEVAGQNLLPQEPAYRAETGYGVYFFEGTQSPLPFCLERVVLPVKPSVKALCYLGTPEVITALVQSRSMYASALFVCFLIILVLSAAAYLRYRADHMLIMLLISGVSVIKGIIAGDLPQLSRLAGITLENLFFWDSVTGILTFLLSQLLCYRLFRFSVRRRWLIGYLVLFTVVQGGYLVTRYLPLMVGMHLVGVLVILLMGSRAYRTGVPHSVLLLMSYSVFSATVIYRFLITFGLFSRGVFSELCFSPQIGNLLYLSAFLFSVLMSYWERLKELERQQKLFDRITLLRGLNHDLKLPLSVIRLNAQMLDAYESSREETLEYAQTILEATAELEGLTHHIHGYLGSGAPAGSDQVTDLRERLEQSQQQYHSRSVLQQVSFTVNGPIGQPAGPIRVSASPQQIDRILHNLLDNAFKYTGSPGRVSLDCTASDTHIIITVSDDGIGMSPEEVSQACEPLYRAHSSRDREGAGLGLSVVKTVVDSLHGTLQINSSRKTGTRVRITIPRA